MCAEHLLARMLRWSGRISQMALPRWMRCSSLKFQCGLFTILTHLSLWRLCVRVVPPDYVRAEQLSALDVYFSFTGGPTLTELQTHFGVRRTAPLYCSFDPEHYRSYPCSTRFQCAMSYMGTYAPDRQPKLEHLFVRRRKLARRTVHRSWTAVSPEYPLAAQRASYCASQPAMACTSLFFIRITFNITRRDMVMAAIRPLYDCLRLPLAERQSPAITGQALTLSLSLGAKFSFRRPGGSCAVSSVMDERELHAIGLAAQVRVMASHTSQQRAAEFEAEVETRVAPRATDAFKRGGSCDEPSNSAFERWRDNLSQSPASNQWVADLSAASFFIQRSGVRMRVALVASPFISVPPKRYGGTELFIAQLAEGLYGWALTWWCMRMERARFLPRCAGFTQKTIGPSTERCTPA